MCVEECRVLNALFVELVTLVTLHKMFGDSDLTLFFLILSISDFLAPEKSG